MMGGVSDLFSVAGKTALITGGTSGIGLSMAAGLVDAGVHVTIVARSATNCDRVVEELSRGSPAGSARAIPGDLSTIAGVKAIAAQFGAGPLDILVNNAGLLEQKPFPDYSEELWDHTLDLNLKGAFFLIQALLTNLRLSATPEDPARVVNISSGHGHRISMFDHFGYTASKAGLNHLSRQLAQKLAPENINVNVIAPGVFATLLTSEFSDDLVNKITSNIPRGRFGEADDVVGALIYLSSRAGAYVTSAVLPVDGGWAGIA